REEPLVRRLLAGEPQQFADELLVPTELEIEIEELLKRTPPDFLQPNCLRLQQASRGNITERQAAPDLQRFPLQFSSRFQIPLITFSPSYLEQFIELIHINFLRGNREDVSTGSGPQGNGFPVVSLAHSKDFSDLVDVGLHGGTGAIRRPLVPQLLD